MKISDYYLRTFRSDLATFMGQPSAPYFGHSWRYDCRGLVSDDELHAQLAPGMQLFVAEVVSFFRDHMPDLSAAEFFDRLAYDRDVQIPLLVIRLDKTVAESTDYRAYYALQQAIKNAGIEKIA